MIKNLGKLRLFIILTLLSSFCYIAANAQTAYPVIPFESAGKSQPNELVQRYRKCLSDLELELQRSFDLPPELRRKTVQEYLNQLDSTRKITIAAKTKLIVPEDYHQINTLEDAKSAIDEFYLDSARIFLTELLDKESTDKVACYFLLGNLEMKAMNWLIAGKWFEKAAPLSLVPDHAIHLAAKCQIKAKKFNLAAKNLEKIIENHTEYVFYNEARNDYCRILVERKNWIELGKIALQTEPSASKYFHLFMANLQLKNKKKATDFLSELYLNYPSSDYVDRGLKIFSEQYQPEKTFIERFSSEQIFLRAQNLEKAGSKSEAAKIYQALLMDNLDSELKSEIMLYLAKIWHDTRKNSDALKIYDEFIRLYPDHSSIPTVLFRQGTIYRRQGNDRRFFETTGKIAEKYEWSTRWDDALLRQSEVYRGLKNFENARSDLNKVVRKRSGDIRTLAKWKLAWLDYDQEMYSKAAEKFSDIAKNRQGTSWEPQAQYWMARAYERIGNMQKAQKLYMKLIENKSWNYSGILAWQHVKGKFDTSHNDQILWTPDPLKINSNTDDQNYVKAMFLERTGFHQLAFAEFNRYQETQSLVDDQFLKKYAQLLVNNGQVLMAQRLIIRRFQERVESGHLPVEFAKIMYPIPKQCRNFVFKESACHQVDPYLILSLILRESGFDPAALSINLAAGYMQLMPSLFERMRGNWGIDTTDTGRFIPEYNIRAGVQYIRILLDRYDGNISKSLAAYNAGEHRVDSWQQQFPDLTDDEWIEHIPFQQTRLFVKKIIENYHCYKAIYTD